MATIKSFEKHYVKFLSPGTFVSETTMKPISEWDTKEAVAMAKKIKERYGATPYGFRFITRIEAAPIKTDGGELKVEPKMKKMSGIHYITGTIRTAKQVLSGTSKDEDILRSNIRCNDIPAIITNDNSYRTTMPFEKDSVLVDWSGEKLQVGLKGL